MARRLIVNADDFNLTEGVVRGILEAHRNGIVTSTTVMVNLPGLEHARGLTRSAPGLGLGLHLNLTFGPPVLAPDRLGSLVDGDGRFIRDPSRLKEGGRLPEIRAELRAQVERFEATFGQRPSHLDTHHHIHRHRRTFEALLDLAAALRVPLRALTPEMAEEIRGRGLPAADRAVGDVGPDAYWTSERLRAFLGTLPEGVTELMCHPGYADTPLAASSYCGQREVELRALCDPDVRGALAAAGVQPIAYRDLTAAALGRP